MAGAPLDGLEAAFSKFIESDLHGESIDRLELTKAQKLAERADYLLFDRSVIVEVKSLADDRELRVRAVIDRWRSKPGWPVTYVEMDLQQILDRHPQGDRINKELFDKATASIETAVEKAHRQLRSSRRVFEMPNALGVLFILNEHVDVLTPDILVAKLRGMLGKMGGDGNPRYPSLDAIVLITWAHLGVGESRELNELTYTISRNAKHEEILATSPCYRILERWAAHRGKPFKMVGTPESEAALGRVPVIGRKPPLVI